ncbi:MULTISPECIES: YraN family protein [Asticcacaulis]|uniref:YraN family protein n=1 Tax=Asticcacaulis TaxID=76890 RepID=UPI0028671FB3|nr:YraN family protein [Asticcacaulis sp. BE141]MBP2159829.1 putative endonuclease [Asticcacaulis solisilvae]MDR6800874.1 putative endonuclease [Asticcacaulis sp. BE141]
MDRAATGFAARKRGHLLEYVALVHLMLKGYRILGFRLKTPRGEIDILAQKGQRLAVIEVKSRMTIEAAVESVSFIQQERLWQAGLALQARKPQLARLDLNIDLYTLVPGQWPRHAINAFEKVERF